MGGVVERWLPAGRAVLLSHPQRVVRVQAAHDGADREDHEESGGACVRPKVPNFTTYQLHMLLRETHVSLAWVNCNYKCGQK